MPKKIFINMENESFEGNILDIGLKNDGVIYNMCKKSNKNMNIEYFSGKEEKIKIKEDFYDICTLFFSLRNLWPDIRKKNFLLNIKRYLKESGFIYVWDMDKGYNKIVNCNIKVLMPKREIRRIKIKDFNLLKNTSKENTIKILEKYFNIVDIKEYDGAYCIKAQKVKEVDNKSCKDGQTGDQNTASTA